MCISEKRPALHIVASSNNANRVGPTTTSWIGRFRLGSMKTGDTRSGSQASKNIKKALALDDEDYLAHLSLSQLYVARKEHDKAIAALERAIAINPNGADAYAMLGGTLAVAGESEKGIKLLEKSLRLNPNLPPHHLNPLGVAYHLFWADMKMRSKCIKKCSNVLQTTCLLIST